MSATKAGARAAKFLVITLVLLVVALVAGEVLARTYVANEVRSAYQQEVRAAGAEPGAEPEVSFGSAPLIAAPILGSVRSFAMTTPDSLTVAPDGTVTGLPGADIDISGMELSAPYVARDIQVVTSMSDEVMLAAIRQALAENVDTTVPLLTPENMVTKVTSQPERNVIEVEFLAGAARLSLTPAKVGDQATIEAAGAEILGFDLPAEVTTEITRALQEGAKQQAGPALTLLEDLTVVDGGLRVTASGTDVPLQTVLSSGNS
ncbi:LmeA family phospholipid-binding protein [Corynebacterium uterequi]|uniref:DUF2993 family protein n=1 Tax=Corynebacterium uterequi TaxID=1072256 RepID=A0A0G3HAA7_9CORY|nr:LmeA family phospholipid-binding protein [Corynebacterium uterequi]AKK10249.1 hypothetical protein CUTER_01145 [Corynebacterium uterequi]